MKLATPLILGLCLIAHPCLAQSAPAPYGGQQARPIKGLSAEDVAALLKGEGMGMAKPAELNGYPGPRHVLDFAAQLKLTPDQRQKIQSVFGRMSAAAKSLGAELVERERGLDQLFQKGQISADRLTEEAAGIGELQGRLRAVHLSAHLETRALLTADQIAVYQHLRGYDGPGVPMRHRHHG